MGEVLSMGFLDKFEKGVENVTNRAMSRFSDDIEPIEIASKLRETMDKRAASFARDRSVVPNIFRIHLTPPSIERITAWGQDEMVRQMEEVATSHAADQGYSFVGPVEVSFLVNNNPNAPALERHPFFPNRTNVEFASMKDGKIYLDVYERGAGWTLACGTGACAAAVAAVLNGYVSGGAPVEVRLPGGWLTVKIERDLECVYMEGPAALVAYGEIFVE